MSKLTIHIPLPVEPKQSDRSSIIQPKGGGKPFVHHYPSKKVDNNAKALMALLRPHSSAKPLKGPLRLVVDVYYPWRVAETKKRRAMGQIPKDTWPDWDNLGKQVCDVMEKLGFFRNDSQIASGTVNKWWGGVAPRLVIELETIQGKGER